MTLLAAFQALLARYSGQDDIVIGADGATSVVARSAGLVSPQRVLWGFAIRGYLSVDVTLPVIALMMG